MELWQTNNLMRNKMISKQRIAALLSASFFLGTIFLQSCKKEDNQLGLNLQPQGDQVGLITTDTLSLITYSELSDSIVTDELASSNMLGSYLDPYMGKISSNIYTQIRLEGSVNFIPDGGSLSDVAIDSVILYLDITDFYGTLDEQNFEVYRLTEDFFLDSSYYSNSSLTNDGLNLVASGQGSVTPNGDLLRLPLSVSDFAQPIVDQSGSSVLAGNDDNGQFVEWFKGLYITTNTMQSSGDGSILYIDLESSDSKVTMYYRHTLGAVTEHDTLEFDFNINSSCARFSSFEQDYTGTIVEQILNDSTVGQEIFFTQTMGGVRAKIAFPNFLNIMEEDKVIINKASLYMPVQYFTGDALYPAEELLLIRTSDDGSFSFLPDYDEDRGGGYVAADKAYTFNVTRYLNGVLSGDYDNEPLTILSRGTAVTANRVVFNGPATILKDQPKLIITYSKFE